jgi:GTPase Era involved in 16S rRNA processing
MDNNTEKILNRVQELYCAKGLKEDYKNILGFLHTRNIQSLEEIGRDELFKYKLKDFSANYSHYGIITRPSKKATVLIIGNHSAGKSSFINWYTGEKVQSTGIAIETSHFTMITHGEKTSEIKSEGTMAMYPFFREIMARNDKSVYGTFFANLNTKICNKTEKFFQFVDFIDTPGLTDGNIKYNCDIVEMTKWVANYVDLVLVFLDPIGQSLCLKTMEMVDFLQQKHSGKLKVCLSKIDQIENESDFQKLHMQIYSNLAIKTDQIQIELIPFTIVPDCKLKSNRIQDLLDSIEKAFKSKALTNIEILTADCYFILNLIDYLRDSNQKATAKNNDLNILKVIFTVILLLILSIIALPHSFLGAVLPLSLYTGMVLMGILGVILLLLFSKKYELLSSNQLQKLENWAKYCDQALAEAQEMTTTYLNS